MPHPTQPSGGGGGSPTLLTGWTYDGGPPATVRLTTSTNIVSVGNNAGVANRKFSVYNTGTDLGVSVVTLASTDNVLETFVSGEANLRWSVNGSGATRWGAGGASALDTRLYRSSANTLTLDNGAGGSAALVPGADSVGNIGTRSLRWTAMIANTHDVYAGLGDLNASTTLASGSLAMGAGGAAPIDTRLSRTGPNTLTVDDSVGGPAVLRVLGQTNTQQRVHAFVGKAFADTGYVVAAADDTAFWNCGGGSCTTTLPTPVGAGGRELVFKRTDTSVNTLTLTPAAGQIEGAAFYVVLGGAGRASVTVRSDNSNWWII